MMKTYYVYNHPLYGQRIVETGTSFTFLGFFFTVIWLAIKKLYLIATLTFVLLLMTVVADKIVNNLMLSKINTVLSTPLSELYENDRYREIYLSIVDPEVAPWKTNKARSKPKYIDPWADTAIQGEEDKFYDPDEAFSSSDPATKGLAYATSRPAPELSENQKFIQSRMKSKQKNAKKEELLNRAKPATYAYAMEQIKDLEVIGFLILLPSFALQIFIGFNGREWVIRNLKRRGYELTDTIQAHTKDAVLAQLARKKTPTVPSA